jgi:hypothetical protein
MPTPRTLYAKSGDVHLADQAIGDGPRGVPDFWELYAAGG